MYIKEIKIKSYDVGRDDNAKISSVMKYFQQIARENLDQFGMTYKYLREHNIAFVLTKYKFKFHKELHCDCKYIFKTSPCETVGVSFVRDFIIEDSDGNICCEASSTWVIIDFEKRSILRPNKLPLPISNDPKLVDFLPERISTNVRDDKRALYETTVLFSQLDANNHLNNCCYVDILTDGIFAIKNNVPFIKTLEMSFDHEAAVNSQLTLDYYFEDNFVSVLCNNQSSGQSCFTAKVEF